MDLKNTVYFFLLLLVISSCQSKIETENKQTSKTQTIEEESSTNKVIAQSKTTPQKKQAPSSKKPDSKELATIIVADETQYSSTFIEELRRASGMKRIEFNKNMMVLNQKDSITFPKVPSLNKRMTFTARKDDLAIALIIKRINYTSIEYRIELVEFGQSSKTENGIAHLGGFFFLGSESDTNDQTGEEYFSTEYATATDSCYTYIRLGILEESNNQILAKVIKNCNGKIKDITIDNFPNLREK